MSEDFFKDDPLTPAKKDINKSKGIHGPARSLEEVQSTNRIDAAIRENLPKVTPPSEVRPSAGVDPKVPSEDQHDPRP